MRFPDLHSVPPPVDPHTDVDWARAVLTSAVEECTGIGLRNPALCFGDYELLEALGRGATAMVYRARQVSLSRNVALKVMVDADLANEAEVQRFLFGAQAAAELDHPNIAPIYHVSVHEGVPFFAMRLFEGGTLAQALHRLRGNHVNIATLVAKIARAVHYAHERGVLHRDLKPANVVLDEHDEPFVVDFGFAKHLDERAATSKPSILVGTMGYMAPEQAAGDQRSLTFASDIYALGAMLYELLTGELPGHAMTLAELVEHLTGPAPVKSPRALDPQVDRELEYICLKCLNKDPLRRYSTAAELALDLERWLRFEPIAITTEGSAARMWRWCVNHPALATLLLGAVCVLAATSAVAASVAREQEQVLLSGVQHANAYAAQAKAGQVLFQLRELASPVARCASDPRVADLLSANSEIMNRPLQADRLLLECGARTLFDSVAVISRDGIERARLPRRSARTGAEDIMRRDYFQGAEQLGESGYRWVHVGRVLRSDDNGVHSVSLSAPVYGAENDWLGVLSVTVDMGAFLESLYLEDSGRQMAVLAGVREREPGDPTTAQRDGVMVLLHGKLGDTQDMESARSWLNELKRLKDQAVGRDPFRFSETNHSLEDNFAAYPVTAFGNRWLAGFAPVGRTGYAVVVQTRYDIALEEQLLALKRLLGWSGAMFLAGASAVLALAFRLGKRTRRTQR